MKTINNKQYNECVEHWNNGNYDNSYAYGVEVGEQYAYREIFVKLKAFLKNYDNSNN